MDIRIKISETYQNLTTGETYFRSMDGNFLIKKSFIQSKEFDSALIKTLFAYYATDFEKFIIDNEGFDLAPGDLNNLFKRIGDLTLIKFIAEQTDGFLNYIDLPANSSNINEYTFDKNTNLVFINYT